MPEKRRYVSIQDDLWIELRKRALDDAKTTTSALLNKAIALYLQTVAPAPPRKAAK